ncbi:RNA-directed DNA polymerase, eukaryota, reverse transcriptase zinc-binding domain protein [Tanacetum coccineum]
MPTNKRVSKRRIKIPIRFGDSVCDLVQNMYSKDKCEEDGDSDEIGDSSNDESCEKGETELIPTAINDGREVVILEDDMVIEGSKKWMISLCGHFYGYKMSYAKIIYNLGRMWGKYGLINIVTQNGVYLFKFKDEVGMNQVLESVPWMIVKGISANASSLGRPLIMDKTTAKMCHDGTDRVGYARVLAEVNVEKVFKRHIEVCYKCGDNGNKCSKQSNGAPVFGNKEQRNMDDKQFRNDFNRARESKRNNVASNKNREKKDAQRNIRTMNKRKNKPKVRYEFRPKEKEVIKEGTRRTQDKPNKNNKRSRNEKVNNSHVDTNCHSPKSSWKLNKENMKNRRRSANKFSVMEDIEDVEVFDGTKKSEHEIVDKFMRYQRQPTTKESKDSSSEMFKYFKEQWKMYMKRQPRLQGIWQRMF